MKVLAGPMSLTREHVLAALDLHAQELRRLGTKSLALFGSVARGEGFDSSDIDLLVELEPKTFDAYMDVKLFLEEVLGRRVDLVLADAVKPRLRSGILAEAVHASRL
jgi:predicted nucleotidyltransferase